MYFLCTTNLITSHKNQPLLLSQGCWLKEKKMSNDICNISRNSEQMSGELHINFLYKFFELTNQSFVYYPIGCTSYVQRI